MRFYFFSVLSVNAVVKNKKPHYVKENRKESQPLHGDMDTADHTYLRRLISQPLNRIYNLLLCPVKMFRLATGCLLLAAGRPRYKQTGTSGQKPGARDQIKDQKGDVSRR